MKTTEMKTTNFTTVNRLVIVNHMLHFATVGYAYFLPTATALVSSTYSNKNKLFCDTFDVDLHS